MNLKEKWNEFNKDYAEINKEVKDKGFSTVGNLIFFPLFVFGFIYVKNIGNAGFDIKTPFEIVFNWSLVGYSFSVSVLAWLMYLVSKNMMFKGFLTRAFETTLSLFFICLAGYSMREVDLPFLDPTNKYGFLFLTELIVFSYLWLSIKFFVGDNVVKKKKALNTLLLVAAIFLLAFIASVFVS